MPSGDGNNHRRASQTRTFVINLSIPVITDSVSVFIKFCCVQKLDFYNFSTLDRRWHAFTTLFINKIFVVAAAAVVLYRQTFNPPNKSHVRSVVIRADEENSA